MPATEETWRSQPLLHRIFAASGVGLLVATLWMFGADHFREWKPYQRNMVKVDTTLTRLLEEQYRTSENERQHEALLRKVAAAKAEPLDAALYEEFKKTAKDERFTRLDADVKSLAELAEAAAAARSAADAFAKKIEAAEGDLNAADAALAAAKPAERAEAEKARAAKAAALEKLQDEARTAKKEADSAEQAAARVRERALAALDAVIKKARFKEDLSLNNRKIAAAELDAEKAAEGILVRDNRPARELARMQASIESLKAKFDRLTLEYQDASTYRKSLQELVRRMGMGVEEAEAELKKNEVARKQLETAFKERQSTFFVSEAPFLGKRILELPILDAFGSPRRPENLWSEGLLIDYNFSKVRRFDRCTTCHQAMDKSAPGSATEPAYVEERFVELVLATPPEADLRAEDKLGDGARIDEKLLSVYGLKLTEEGLLNPNDVTVSLALPGKLAARAALAPTAAQITPVAGDELRRALLEAGHPAAPALEASGLLVGDVVVKVNDDNVSNKAQFVRLVLGPSVKWGSPLRVTVRRGLPHPYVSHPRLDLFVGSLSPHKMQTFGCTICHEGQGSATAFKWASHTPNDPEQRKAWVRQYGWFDNHHWIFPQNPKRFLESGCLKCHHEVTELEPSERFPDPPAPKVVHGHDLIRKYGCYGCHEINGYDGPNRRVGPDLRLEPMFFAVAEELLTHLPPRREAIQAELNQRLEKLAPQRALLGRKLELEEASRKINEAQIPDEEKQQKLAPLNEESQKIDGELTALKESLATETAEAAMLLAHLNRLDQGAALAERLVRNPDEDESRRKLRQLLEVDRDTPADAFGPTFTAAAYRLIDLLKDIDAPGKLRKPGPSLRRASAKLDPAFLVDWIKEPKHFRPSTRMPQFFGLFDHLEPTERAGTEQKERIEVLGMAAFLLDRSQKFEYLSPADGAAEEDRETKIARGKQQFQTRGCLACHNHQDFPEVEAFRPQGEIVQGPDLSGLSAKFSADRNSNGRKWLYSWIKQPSRYHTRTVMPDLFLDAHHELPGKAVGTDPADDIVEYLLSVTYEGWHAPEIALNAEGGFQLDEPTRIALKALTRENLSETFFERAAEKYLASGIPESMRAELKGAEVELVGEKIGDRELLLYIGRKSLGKYGCYGCHDIPGFEDAKPIGTGLADWGRKEPAKLAFEHIAQYLHAHTGHEKSAPHGAQDPSHAGHAAEAAPRREPLSPFYLEQIESGNRIGFAFQKLREPRSYDYHKVANKRYNERLRMPLFPINDEEREAIVTFVLGLVAEPPGPKYVYTPSPRQKALAEGRQVLEKYNCGGCHVLEIDKWKVAFAPKEEGPPGAEDLSKVYPFLRSVISPETIAASQKVDPRGLLHATLTALPALRGQPGDDGLPEMYDSEGDPVEGDSSYAPDSVRVALDLWAPALLNGRHRQVGGTALQVPLREIEKHYPSQGGVLAKYLIQPVFRQQKALDSSAKVAESWGWLPPPLVGQGNKVQAEWLHDFLLDPRPIRPAVVLRMPKFNMSSEEATRLVNYFAAVDNADFPYEFSDRRREQHLVSAERQYEELAGELGAGRSRMEDALKIVTNVCVKCHLVGDYAPGGTALVKGPNLSKVDRRLRPTYLRDWIADPKRILPYTGMPVNVPFDENAPNFGTNIGQDLFHGNSFEQLDGLVDLLANFDEYTKGRVSIKPLVKEEPAAPAAEAPAAEQAP